MTRLIQLADDAYELLARRKGPGDSFSDVVRRHFPRRSLLDLVGFFDAMTPQERAQTDRYWKIGREIAEQEIDEFYKNWQARQKAEWKVKGGPKPPRGR